MTGAFWAVGPKIFDWPLRRATHDVQLDSVESGTEVDVSVLALSGNAHRHDLPNVIAGYCLTSGEMRLGM